MLSLRTHNVLDYVVGIALLLLAGSTGDPSGRTLFMSVGATVIIYSLVTDYRYSLVKWLSIGFHMTLDFIAGVLVAAGPWLFGYKGHISGGQTALHLVLGLGFLAVMMATDRTRRTAIGVFTETEERISAASGRRY